MNKTLLRQVGSFVLTLVALLVFAGSAFADDHGYQVTGPVLAVTPTSITVKKGKATKAGRSGGFLGGLFGGSSWD